MAASRDGAPIVDDSQMRGILISIKPEFSARIASGVKRVEFRRRASCTLAGAWGLVYESRPTCAVVMRVRFGAVVRASPGVLWTRYSARAGVDRGGFNAYLDGCATAWALEIDAVDVLAVPRDLSWLRTKGVGVPVSYAMIAKDARWVRGLLPTTRNAA